MQDNIVGFTPHINLIFSLLTDLPYFTLKLFYDLSYRNSHYQLTPCKGIQDHPLILCQDKDSFSICQEFHLRKGFFYFGKVLLKPCYGLSYLLEGYPLIYESFGYLQLHQIVEGVKPCCPIA